jgi:transcriptional regulator with XRE-family HTH domain
MHATLDRHAAEVNARWAAAVARAKGLGWSQNKLAEKLRTERGHLSRVIRGERQSMKLLTKAEALVARAEAKRRAA